MVLRMLEVNNTNGKRANAVNILIVIPSHFGSTHQIYTRISVTAQKMPANRERNPIDNVSGEVNQDRFKCDTYNAMPSTPKNFPLHILSRDSEVFYQSSALDSPDAFGSERHEWEYIRACR